MKLLFLLGVVVWHATNSNAVIPGNSVIRSVNTFSNNFVQAIAEDVTGNFVSSPVSADVVLSMITYGARGNTEKVLREALALKADDDAVTKNGFQTLVDDLSQSKGFELRMANKVFLADGVEPTADFKETTEITFRSKTENLDFSKGTEAAKTINDWSETQTNNRIKDLVKASDFNADTALVLVNAVYFKAEWKTQFDEFDTKPLPFHVSGKKTTKKVQTMMNLGFHNHGELPDVNAKFLEIPYKSDRASDAVSMFIILPNEIDGIFELVKNLQNVTVKRLQSGSLKNIHVELPKFKIETTLDLKKPLNKLGLEDIFSDNADFSGIVPSPPLSVSKVVQKAFIEVNEKGTEAAAATEIEMTFRSSGGRITKFIVDHPFVAVIATRKGVPLFTSVVTEPIY